MGCLLAFLFFLFFGGSDQIRDQPVGRIGISLLATCCMSTVQGVTSSMCSFLEQPVPTSQDNKQTPFPN